VTSLLDNNQILEVGASNKTGTGSPLLREPGPDPLSPSPKIRRPGQSRNKAFQTSRCGPDYINRMKAEVRKRSEMPLQLPSWCLLLSVAPSKAGP
jgi:hypothetical protein